jgi:hypothetical protein
MTIQLKKLDLSRYNLVELEVFLDTGIITVDEFETEVEERGLTHTIVTPPEN